MRLSTIEQIIYDTNMFISFGMTHWHSSISWMVKEFVRLSEELFFMNAFVLFEGF